MVKSLLSIVLPAFNEEGNNLPPAARWSRRRMTKRHLRYRAEELP